MEGNGHDYDNSGALGVPSQADDVVKEGWLWKKHQKAQLWSGWHQRYFVLRRSASTLVYHRSANITSKCRGKIELGTNSEIQFRGPQKRDSPSQRTVRVYGPVSHPVWLKHVYARLCYTRGGRFLVESHK